MSDGKHTEICDEQTHQKLDRNWWDYTPCPKCGAEPVWDSQTLACGDEWPLLIKWAKPEIVTSWTNPTANPLEDLKSYRDKIMNDCMKFTEIPTKFLNGHFNCDDLSVFRTDPAAGRDWTASNIIDSVKRIRGDTPHITAFEDSIRAARSEILGALKINISNYLCNVQHVRFRRNHRKARVNKKWHKKYGSITRCVANAFQIEGMGLVMCPCRKRELDEAIKKQNQSAEVPR